MSISKILLYSALDTVKYSTFWVMCINFKVVLLFLKRALAINIFNEIAKNAKSLTVNYMELHRSWNTRQT